MKEKDEGMDDVFRKGLEDPVNDAAYREADWDAMEQMLDKHKKRPAIIYWLPIMGSAAALVLIFLGWLLLRPVAVQKPQKGGQLVSAPHPAIGATGVTGTDQAKKDATKETTGISGSPARQTANSSSQKLQAPANYAKNRNVEGHGRKNKSFFALSAGAGRRDTGIKQNNAVTTQQDQTLAVNPDKKSDSANATVGQSVIANNTTPPVQTNTAPADTSGKAQLANNGKSVVNDNKPVKKTIKPNAGYRPQFALGVIASSDLNGVNSSFQQSKVGGNFGLVLSMGLSKKWTISAGASYDIKPYLTGINNYHTNYVFPTEPVSVSANCRMLEVPINVNYQVYGKHNNKISIGTGLSSYFMLREDYTFNYSSQYASGPAGFSVSNQNRNILSIVNIDATYQHQVNSRVGIIIQPYLKIPLSNVGESQVRLQTSGIAAGVSWNINSLTKK